MAYDPRKLVARRRNPTESTWGAILLLILAGALAGGYFLYRWWRGDGRRTAMVWEYLRDPAAHADWAAQANARCPGAPFAFPTSGYIGYLYGDSFQPLHKHTGIDVFGNRPIGETPVYAAYDGFLTRLPEWKSAVIIRVADDPLSPGREIWLYYAHMADAQGNSFIAEEFPPGTAERPVKTGELLGYQGNYSGDPEHPTGLHLHFSIVLGDGNGGFRNETRFENTLDPSPYFGMALDAHSGAYGLPQCIIAGNSEP
ncbi:MAG: M23 family metallopeptidase [Anaerolineales bacterium]|nr:M23 family metallopeptidase [Anaerolineales bacterium]